MRFTYKGDTDLYDLAKVKAIPTSVAVSQDGKKFAVTSKVSVVDKPAKPACG